MIKKNKIILLSLLSAMATPLALQPVHASFAEKLSQQAVEKQRKEEAAVKAKAESEAQVAKQKEMSSVVAVENKSVQDELNALISDINSNLGSGLTVVKTADKSGLTDGVKEVKKALDGAVKENKDLKTDLATLKTEVETLLASIDAKSGKAAIAKPADASPATLIATIKLADADVKAIPVGGPPVVLAGLKTDIEALLTSLNGKTGKAIANPADDKPATLQATLKLADADVKTLASTAEMATLGTDINTLNGTIVAKTLSLIAAPADNKPATLAAAVKAMDAEVAKLTAGLDMNNLKKGVSDLIGSLNAHSGKVLAAPADTKAATLIASLKSADTDLKGLAVGGLPLTFAGDIAHVNTELAKVLGAQYDPATMDFKVNGTGLQASVNAFVAKIGTLPANYKTKVKDKAAATPVFTFYGALEKSADEIYKTLTPGGPKSGQGKFREGLDKNNLKL